MFEMTEYQQNIGSYLFGLFTLGLDLRCLLLGLRKRFIGIKNFEIKGMEAFQ